MRWMGIDLGERRIGLALSDPLQITAQAYKVLQDQGSLNKNLASLKEEIERNEVTGVVMGLPRNMDGSEGPMAEKVRGFGQRLEKFTSVKVNYWDERLSTVAAQRVLLEADLSRRKRRAKIDQVAAAIILQNFLDSQPGIKSE